MAIRDYPVLIGATRRKLSYEYRRSADSHSFDLKLDGDVEQVDVRLGLISEDKQVVSVGVNGVSIEFEELYSGDSRWVWIHQIPGGQSNVEVQFQ
jgi:hypothetical protein